MIEPFNAFKLIRDKTLHKSKSEKNKFKLKYIIGIYVEYTILKRQLINESKIGKLNVL